MARLGIPDGFGTMDLMSKDPSKRPGDVILDRYMPDATDAEREVVRERLRRFAVILVQIDRRQRHEQLTGDDSPDRDGRDRVEVPAAPAP